MQQYFHLLDRNVLILISRHVDNCLQIQMYVAPTAAMISSRLA